MAKLSQRQIAALWVANGGRPSKADEASAISMAESGGDSTIGNGTCCWGLWQLNVDAGVSTKKCATNMVCSTKRAISLSRNGRDWSPWEAYTNGHYSQFMGGSGHKAPTKREAKSVLADLKLGPLDVPLPGPDVNPLGPLTDPLGSLTDPLGGLGGLIEGGAGIVGDANIPVISDLANSLRNIAAFFRGVGELLLTPEGWLRLGKLLGGVLLLFWGLRIVIRESTGTDPVKAATKTVAKGAEVAALAATVK